MFHETWKGTHKCGVGKELNLILTNFPQSCAKFLVIIKRSSELITMVQNYHQTQELIRRYSVVNIIVAQELVRHLDKQQL